MTNEIEKKLQFRDARCYKSNNKKCNDNISEIEQLANMTFFNTASLKFEFNKIMSEEQYARCNVLNFKEHKKEKLRESDFLQKQFKDGMGAINDNNICDNRTVSK